jgi:hypothetical protein
MQQAVPIVVAGLGGLDATDATISDLDQTDRRQPRPACALAAAAPALTRTSLLRNSTGLVLAGSQGAPAGRDRE